MKYYLKCPYTFQKHFVGILIHVLVFVRTLVMFTEVGVIAGNRVRCEFFFYINMNIIFLCGMSLLLQATFCVHCLFKYTFRIGFFSCD